MNKIEALKKTIYNLENDVYEYNWSESNSCNCGILARSISGTREGIDGYYNSPDVGDMCIPPWTRRSICLKTGLPLSGIWKTLKDIGFTHDEIANLESLSDKKIADKTGMEFNIFKHSTGFSVSPHRSEKRYVISYLKAWVEILEEEAKLQLPERKEIIRYVAVIADVREDAVKAIEEVAS